MSEFVPVAKVTDLPPGRAVCAELAGARVALLSDLATDRQTGAAGDKDLQIHRVGVESGEIRVTRK